MSITEIVKKSNDYNILLILYAFTREDDEKEGISNCYFIDRARGFQNIGRERKKKLNA